MNLYTFDLHVQGPIADPEQIADQLYATLGTDTLVSIERDNSGGTVGFNREASSAIIAIATALEEVERCGLRVTSAGEDLVTVSDIADRTGRTQQGADHWTRGKRGPGGFPPPRIPRERNSLYSSAEVASWLASHGLAEVNPVDVESAAAVSAVNAALIVRRLARMLPRRNGTLAHLIEAA